MAIRQPAAVHQPASVPDVTTLSPGEWLASWVAAREAQAATAMRLIAAGGRSNDSCLHARQFLEQSLGSGRGSPLTSADYQRAAGLLDGKGKTQLGEAMDALASVSWELQAAAAAWHNRYAARPQTQPERIAAGQIRNGDVVESGHAGPGIDGAHYSRAYYPRSGKPAIVITTSAMTEEIVNFANTQDAAAWLASRSAGITGPLPTSATGPASRTAREEELLAFLVRDPGQSARLAGMAGPATFTTHLRAELFAALRWVSAGGGTPATRSSPGPTAAACCGPRPTRPGTSAGRTRPGPWPTSTASSSRRSLNPRPLPQRACWLPLTEQPASRPGR